MTQTSVDVLGAMCACGVLPVFRTDRVERVMPASRAMYEGGIPIIEYTLTMPGALGLIEQARAQLPADMLVGAGTILDAASARLAILAGAQFAVSPGMPDRSVVEMCHRYGVPFVPGAVTPTEVMRALELGCSMIKVFPACDLSPAYVRELAAPFTGARFMMAAGITLENAGAYIAAGASVVTQAAQAMDAEAFAAGDLPRLSAMARRFVEVVRRAREARQ